MFVIPAKAGLVEQFFKPNGATTALSSGSTGCRIKSGMTGFDYLIAGLIVYTGWNEGVSHVF